MIGAPARGGTALWTGIGQQQPLLTTADQPRRAWSKTAIGRANGMSVLLDGGRCHASQLDAAGCVQ